MKKLLSILISFSVISFYACNNNADNSNKGVLGDGDSSKILTDSLEKEIDEGHMAGMGKYGQLKSMKLETERMLDSISKLPAKAREAAEPLKTRLYSVLTDLAAAKDDMDKWMREFDMDSAVSNTQRRIEYLTSEKMKVGKVKASILQSLQRADSLIRKNF